MLHLSYNPIGVLFPRSSPPGLHANSMKNVHTNEKQINKGARKAAKVVGVKGVSKSAPKSEKGLVKRVKERQKISASDLSLWMESLSYPFGISGRFCPVNYNPAPSFIQSTARTTYTNLSFTVNASTTSQLVLYPGHSTQVSTVNSYNDGGSPMDAVSYHARDVSINGTLHVVGPMSKTDNVSTKTPVGGAIRTGITLGSTENSTAADSVPLTYDVALPYTSNNSGSLAGGAHSRWQLVSMGLRVRNVTPALNRAGSVITVQPNNTITMVSGASQATYEIYPTFYDHGVADDGFEISWIPRAQDLAFWHGTEGTSAAGSNSNISCPGILCWFNALTYQQAYTLEVVFNWQLAGTYLNSVGGPAPHAPEAKPVVEKTLSVLQNSSASARSAQSVSSLIATGKNGLNSVGSMQAAVQTGINMAKRGFAVAGSVAKAVGL